MESFRMVGRSLKFYRDRFREKPRKRVDYASKLYERTVIRRIFGLVMIGNRT